MLRIAGETLHRVRDAEAGAKKSHHRLDAVGLSERPLTA